MTLLVLELHVPEIEDHSSLRQYALAIAPLIPKVISFVLSFVIISVHWVGHHYFFHDLRHAPLGLVWLNNLLLLWICVIPFPTALLGDHPTDQFPILLYGAVSLLSALTFFALRSYATYNNLFIDSKSAKNMGPRHSIPSIAIFALSILLSFVNVYLSLICFALVPLLYFLPTMIKYITKRKSALK